MAPVNMIKVILVIYCLIYYPIITGQTNDITTPTATDGHYFVDSLPERLFSLHEFVDDLIEEVRDTPFIKFQNGFCPERLFIRQENQNPYCFKSSHSCYCSINFRKVNWYEADSFCRNSGMSLMGLESMEEIGWMSQRGRAEISRRFWTSGSDSQTPGTPIWMSTGYEVNMNMTSSSTNENVEPPKNQEEERCVIYTRNAGASGSRSGSLQLGPCTDRNNFICEKFLINFPLLSN